MSNVQNFGAGGDGKNDDTQAIQHCLEQGDGQVIFPRGAYRLTRPIEVDLNRHGRTALTGAGGVAKLVMVAAGPAIHLVG